MQLKTDRRARGQKGGALAVQLPLLPAAPSVRLPLLDQRQRGTDFIGLPVRSLLNSPESTGMAFWSINPYVGCEFGCSYCYARDTHRWVTERATTSSDETDRSEKTGRSGKSGRSDKEEGSSDLPVLPVLSDSPDLQRAEGMSPADLFEHRIYVKEDVGKVLAQTLDPARIGDTPIVIGTATDPYQPAERQFLLTRRLLETFRGFKGLTISITTKSSLVARDVGLLVELSRRHEVSVNLSLATVDPVLLRQLEPRTPLPHARLRALRILTGAGVEGGVMIAPILPGLTDSWSSLAGVVEAARSAGARFVVGHALRLGSAARARFLPLLHRDFPRLAPRYEQHYGNRVGARGEYQKALKRRLRLVKEAYGF